MGGFAEKNGRAGSPLPAVEWDVSRGGTETRRVRLGDVCEIRNGYTPKAIELFDSGETPYFRISAMNLPGNEKEMINPPAWLRTRHRTFEQGSIVFPKNGGAVYTGKVRILRNNSVVDLNTGVCTANDELESNYLYYFISALDIRSVVVPGTIPFVDFGLLSAIEIPLPPLSVQCKIVERLEKELGEAEKVATGFRRIVEKAEAEFKAELDETFKALEDDVSRGGAETRRVRLGDVCETGSGGTPLSSNREYYDGGDVPWLRSGEICKRDIGNTEYCITKKGLNSSSAKIFPADSVVVAMYGATAGQVGILRIASSTNQAICAILPSEKFVPEFLYYQLCWLNDEMVSQAQGGAQPNISQIKIKNLNVVWPILSLQQASISRLDAARERCDKIKAEAEKGLKAAENLRKAILKEAFEQ